MFKRKHTIENLNAKIKNRDKFIDDMCIERNNLREENKVLYEENKDLRYEVEELKDMFKKIKQLSECNTYNNDKAVLGKIKELAQVAIEY